MHLPLRVTAHLYRKLAVARPRQRGRSTPPRRITRSRRRAWLRKLRLHDRVRRPQKAPPAGGRGRALLDSGAAAGVRWPPAVLMHPIYAKVFRPKLGARARLQPTLTCLHSAPAPQKRRQIATPNVGVELFVLDVATYLSRSFNAQLGSPLYALNVFFPGSDAPAHVERILSATEVLARISALLALHDGCERIVVSKENIRLFTVDCHGNSTPG